MCQDIERKQMTGIKTHTWDIACCLHQQPDQLVSNFKTVRIEHTCSNEVGDHSGHGRMVVGFTTICAINDNHH